MYISHKNEHSSCGMESEEIVSHSASKLHRVYLDYSNVKISSLTFDAHYRGNEGKQTVQNKQGNQT
eukprot:snap_masked-scaffold_11-processed-gene-12.48-mRNA-1 protein AED:1.00 eAED:1.00 QI:0/-1/0/0/-1/1/1/0/65